MATYSPRMWRWSYAATQCFLKWLVFSTYVEVILYPSTGHGKNVGILHVCGGDPKSGDRRFLSIKYSPRMWRWSRDQRHLFHGQRVFSTYVEVILTCLVLILFLSSILHVCGGDPIDLCFHINSMLYSPRMWRWSWRLRKKQNQARVFSTYVEVILTNKQKSLYDYSILHVCGGDPNDSGAIN